MTVIIGGKTALSGELRQSGIGTWHCHAEIDGDVNLSGQVTVSIEESEFRGFVRLSHGIGGRIQVWIVGGNGGLSKVIEAQHYTGTNAEAVAADICREAGETLASNPSLASLRLPHWERTKGQASHCLLALCDRLGLTWRVLADGTVWVGSDAWSKISPHVQYEAEDWTAGAVQVFAEQFSENSKLVPGCTWDEQPIEEVVHYFSPEAIRTVVKTDSVSSAMNAFLGSLRRKIEMSNRYLCEVQGQNSDGTLRLKPVDDRIARPGNGLDNVPIRCGLPGFEVKVAQGARVMVEFEGGNPDAPFAALWDQGGDGVTSVEFKPNGLGSPVVRVGDELEVTFPMGMILTTSVGPAALTISTPAKAIITGTGNAKLLA